MGLADNVAEGKGVSHDLDERMIFATEHACIVPVSGDQHGVGTRLVHLVDKPTRRDDALFDAALFAEQN